MRSRVMRKCTNAKIERLELRASLHQTQIIKDAANATSKTVTAFVLDAATLEAQRTLADRRIFRLDPERWNRFVRALERPAKAKPRLRKLMRQPSVLD